MPSIDFTPVQEQLSTLAKLIPPHEFYRYNDIWARTTQQAVFLVIFESYLKNGELVNDIIPAVESSLGGMNRKWVEARY